EAARRRRLVTTHSFDLDQPGVAPWLWPDPNKAFSYDLPPLPQAFDPLGNVQLYPTGKPIPPPPLPPAGTPLPAYPGSEFGAGWGKHNALLGRVDLTRPLPNSPPPGANGQITDMPRFLAAQSARQLLARDIFRRLQLAATGSIVDPQALPALPPSRINALRWLAQLAVNIVDFIDNDDYMTPFEWSGNGTEWVFGTELPRLVVNEALVRRTPVSAPDPGLPAGHPDVYDFWVELHNPFLFNPNDPTLSDPTLSDQGRARLVVRTGGGNFYSVYRVILSQKNANLRQVTNVLGNP